MANLLLGVTGSVAATRTPELCRTLRGDGHALQVVATQASLYFFDAQALRADGVPVIVDADEWPGRDEGKRYQRDDPVLHIELRRWADLLLISPLDANTLAKLANGLCDNCLTCVWRAWDPDRPVVLAPAMNTLMWQHPLTARHLRLLATAGDLPGGLDQDLAVEWLNRTERRLHVVPPQSKRLACGDIGVGAMAAPEVILAAVQQFLRA